MDETPKITPYTGPPLIDRRPDPKKIVNEGPPTLILSSHPAFIGADLGMPSKEELRSLYRAFSGKEPPATIAEWVANLKSQGRDIPPYARKFLDDHPEME